MTEPNTPHNHHRHADVFLSDNDDLEAELKAEPDFPALPAAAFALLPPGPLKKKKKRRKKTLAEKLGVDSVDKEKLQAEFEALVAESRERVSTGVGMDGGTAAPGSALHPDHGSG
ncbi:hypothetical protein PG994_002188 [Apiospora phragmitis]|uniref:Uncharacterized protein n=1 Tax=Apiospora phragmitis TaxID=2905665 RepID=A0ABR1WVQ4_9PEZI